MGGEDGADAGELLRGDGAAEDGDDEVAVVEAVQPMLESGAGDGFKADLKAKLELGGDVVTQLMITGYLWLKVRPSAEAEPAQKRA